MPDIITKNLFMISWNKALVMAAMKDKEKLGKLLDARIPEDFPNEPVRQHVLPDLLKNLEKDASYGQWSGVILNKSEKVAIGTMGFKSPPDEMKHGEIGYDIVPAYQGKGYATEMANAVVQWAFQEKELRGISAKCSPINIASVRVLEKIGMEHVSTTEEIMCWEILNKEYKC